MDRPLMNESEKNEYNSVVLAALLHDIGKFLHRGKGEYQGTHEEASYKFFQKHRETLGNRLYDIDLVSVLARFHGASKTETFRDEYFMNLGRQERERLWKLITVVKRSDSYSCAERSTDQQRKRDINKALSPLDSIFSFVCLRSQEQKTTTSEQRYNVGILRPLLSFPRDLKELDKTKINSMITAFEENLPSFSAFRNMEDVLNWWLSYLEEYVWAVPSDTRYEVSDISLFDHLRASAAISACLYKRHITAIEELRSMPRADEFVLVGGDFSGIQKYIFDVTNRGSGGASKRLRARSFFVSLLSDVAIHKILHRLALPLLCNIFSAGGKFLILTPNIKGTNEILRQIQLEIDTQLHATFFSQFSFLLSWITIKGFRKQFGVGSFFNIADEMFQKLETEKVRKSRSLFLDNNFSWKPDTFRADQLYAGYSEAGDCKICGKGPGIKEDIDPETKAATVCCPVCHRDKYQIGEVLPKVKYVAFGRSKFDPDRKDDRIVLFDPVKLDDGTVQDGYYAKLFKEEASITSDCYLVYGLQSDREANRVVTERPVIRKHYANYVPYDTDGRILSFEQIAGKSIWKKDDQKTYGTDMLGVLKIDIDNLGLVFSKGFEEPGRFEQGLPDIDRKTVSRFLTLSRMIDLFFSGWVKDIMEEDKEVIIKQLLEIKDIHREDFEKYLRSDSIDFRNIYTVYSGGDDMVLVGPWETMIVFAVYMNSQFRKYTCENDSLTLSAGLAFVKEKHPIANAIKQADDFLEKSKTAGKNAISVFHTTIGWKGLLRLINFFLYIDSKMSGENQEINPAFPIQASRISSYGDAFC